jgi:hypothetical protein
MGQSGASSLAEERRVLESSLHCGSIAEKLTQASLKALIRVQRFNTTILSPFLPPSTYRAHE